MKILSNISPTLITESLKVPRCQKHLSTFHYLNSHVDRGKFSEPFDIVCKVFSVRLWFHIDQK